MGADRPQRAARHVVLLVLVSAPLLFVGLSNHGFWRPDEPFVVEVSREMAVSGDWATPRLNGEPFMEKPPLHYAATALFLRGMGVTPLAARLPSFLSALLTIIGTYLLGARLFDGRTALWGALLLPTVFLFFYTAHFCIVDATLLPCVTLGFLSGAYAFGDQRRAWAITGAYAAGALAFLAKGVVGPGLIAIGIISFATMQKDWRFFAWREHAAGLGIFAAGLIAWVLPLWESGHTALIYEALWTNTLGRFLPVPDLVPRNDKFGLHVHGPLAYLVGLPGGFMPWTPLLLMVVLLSLEAWLRRSDRDGFSTGERFLWACFLPAFVLLSIASTKRNIYLLPLYPLLALMVARHARRLADSEARPRRLEWIAVVLQAVLACGASLAVPANYYFQSSGNSGGAVGWPGMATAAGAMAVAVAITTILARRLWQGRLSETFRLIWAQAALAMVVFTVLCVPALDAERSLSPFFKEAVRIENERHRTPHLFTKHESFIGLADLAFQSVLTPPDLAGDTDSVDVLTTEHGMKELNCRTSSTCTVLTKWHTHEAGTLRTLCLISLSRSRGTAGNEPVTSE